ncbi:MAG TPA: quinone oxidoreductase [Thermoanaerobaculia bacterium]
MKAILVRATGGPEVLRLEDLPDPVPGPGEARVRVEAAGVNYIDVYHRTGQYPQPLPFVPGREGAGTVEVVGDGVTQVRPGDRVAWAFVAGSYAEKLIVPAAMLVRVPDGLATEQAAAAMLQGMTAHYLASSTFPLEPGQTCLVHAAAGGVGLLLVQLAKKRGARVIGTVSTEEKASRARAAGADEVLLYGREAFAPHVRRLTGGRGVEVVYDSVGRDTFEGSLDSLARRGMLVLFGQSSGAVAPLDPQVLNQRGSLFLTRPTLGHYIAQRDELEWRAGEVLGAVLDGTLRVTIAAEIPLADADEAHRRLESRTISGKLLLKVSPG